MTTKYKLTRAQHALLIQVMRMELEDGATWEQAMESGKEFYAELIAQKA